MKAREIEGPLRPIATTLLLALGVTMLLPAHACREVLGIEELPPGQSESAGGGGGTTSGGGSAGGTSTGGTSAGGTSTGGTSTGGAGGQPNQGCTSTASLCGRHDLGVLCALGESDGFGSVFVAVPEFDNSAGFDEPSKYLTIQFPDVDGDGLADICSRSSAGLECAIAANGSFAPPTLWSDQFSDADGWNDASHYRTIQFPDLNDDGRQDVCARADDGIRCGLSTGASFDATEVWQPDFGDDANPQWENPDSYLTIRFPDLNGDHLADVCGRAGDGLYCALSNGATFGVSAQWHDKFNDLSGWNQPDHYSTIRFPDVNGDGMDDLCAKGNNDIFCLTSLGNEFEEQESWMFGYFTNNNGWEAASKYSTLEFPDVTGDGAADVCARDTDGIVCGISTGTAFSVIKLWSAGFADATSWDQAPYYESIQYPDINGDGMADVCGRGALGVVCAVSGGRDFLDSSVWQPAFSDADGWDQPDHYSTIAYPCFDLEPDR